MSNVLCWFYGWLRPLYGWLTAQHPHVIEFSSTFVGVLLAASVALWVDKADERRAANNLLEVMQQDCRHVHVAVEETRNTIRGHLGLEGKEANVWDELLQRLEVNPQSEAPDEEVLARLDGIPKLSEFDRRVFNGVVLPATMMQVLTNNVQLYGTMHKLTYTKVLELLPSMTGAHGGYNGLVQEAVSLTLASKQSIASTKSALAVVNPNDRARFEMMLVLNQQEFQQTIGRLLIEAIRALDTYEDRLFRVCHHLESEWRLRECGISEKALYAIYEQPTIHLAVELSCTAPESD